MIMPDCPGYWWIKYTYRIWTNCPRYPQETEEKIGIELFEIRSTTPTTRSNDEEPHIEAWTTGWDCPTNIEPRDFIESIKIDPPW